ncbi:MAG: iron-containing alcohol dehydrogenase [Candidatus Gastranaerophilales bacterium]|nr:iron-containing alcohol dehydrogenase [Candidatus Gastranaerophilales bacterium]
MNIFEKTYCRIFQFCFKVAIPLLPYYNPEILDKVEDIAQILKAKKLSSVLLVTDKSIRNLGLVQNLEDNLAQNEINISIFDEVVPNPTIENVEKAKELYLKNNCQALIAFGGGSVMDCAKAVGARIAKPKQTIPNMAGILRIFKKIPLLFAIPTTAGTGSETTVATVITDSNTKQKYMISDFPLIPKYAVLDASITKSLPPAITATTGMDVLVHAIESFIGNSTTKKTRAQALEATKLVYENLFEAYENGQNLQARKNMLKAAYLAGCAFTVSYVGYCHAVSHTLSGFYNTPHGLANAIIIPYVLEKYGKKIHKKLKQLAISANLCDEKTPEKEAAEQFIQSIKDLNSKMNIGYKIPEIKKDDIEKMAKMAAKEANPIYPVPILMDKNELKEFYYDLI